MKKIFISKQLYWIIFLFIVISLFFGNATRNDFPTLYLRNFTVIPIRYFFILMSVFIEYFVYKVFSNSTIVVRYHSKSRHLLKNIGIEILLSLILFLIFNGIVCIFSFPLSINYLGEVLITIFNFLIVHLTISLSIKMIDLLIPMHTISCVLFLFILICSDFIIDHFNFFFLNYSLFDFNALYTIYYTYPKGILYLGILALIDLGVLSILSTITKRKDFLIKNDEEVE